MAFSNSSYQLFDQYRRIVIRRKWFILIGFVLVFITVAIGSQFLTRIYQANTIIIVEEDDILNPLVRGIAVPSSVNERLSTLRYRMLSRPKLEQVIQHMGLDKEMVNDRGSIDKLISTIKKNLEVKLRGNNLIEISYQDKDPQFAFKIVDTITRDFIEENLREQGEGAASAMNFIQNQLEVYKEKLNQSEAALREFKEKHIHELPGTTNVNLTRMTKAESELAETNLELEQTKIKVENLREQLEKYPELIVSELTKETAPVVTMLKDRLAKLELELTKLQADYTDKHPKVIAIKEEIANTQDRLNQEQQQEISKEVSSINPIRQSLQQQLEDAQRNLETLQMKKNQLTVDVRKYQAAVSNVPLTEQIYAQLSRDASVTSSIYNSLLNKLEEARVSRELELKEKQNRFRIVEPARLPVRPIKPNILKLLLMGAVLGCMTGFGFAMLAEYLDRSFDSVEEIQSRLSIPVIGSIGMFGMSQHSKPSLTRNSGTK